VENGWLGVEYGYNTSWHSTIKKTFKELKNNIQAAQERMKRLYDSKHREEEREEGDWAYLNCSPTDRFQSICARMPNSQLVSIVHFKLSRKFVQLHIS
jgi:hypothetical protein